MADMVRVTYFMEASEYRDLKRESKEVYGLGVTKFPSLLWRAYKARGEALDFIPPPRGAKRSP